jgi:beta-N-acetylhexosaminidase
MREGTIRRPPGPLIVDLDGGLSLSASDRRRLESPHVGGVILFARNFEDRPQLKELVREIKALRSPGLLVTVDQEGGRVQRFKGRFTRLPPAAAGGRLYDTDREAGRQLARETGLVMAAELIECGVDLSFAPVLDVLRCDSRVIGDRAFHSDTEAVHFLAAAYIDGMHEAGMACVGKHFPGHGGVGADSHTCLPEDDRPMSALRDCDLLPYMSLGNRLQGIMLAHVLYGSVNSRIPSYSSFWIRDVLREELGFEGVVFSDDLNMAGAGDDPLLDRYRAALDAGCDLLPVCNDPKSVDRMLKQVEREGLPAGDSTAAVEALYCRPKVVDPAALQAARERVSQAAADAA